MVSLYTVVEGYPHHIIGGFIYPFNQDSCHERWKEFIPFFEEFGAWLRSSTNFRVKDGLAIEICGCDFRLEPCF